MPTPPVPAASARAPPGPSPSCSPAGKVSSAPGSLSLFPRAQQFTLGKHPGLRNSRTHRLAAADRRATSRTGQQLYSRACTFPSARRTATPGRPPLRSPCEAALARAYVRHLSRPCSSSCTDCGNRSTMYRSGTSQSQPVPAGGTIHNEGVQKKESYTEEVAGGFSADKPSLLGKAPRWTAITPPKDSAVPPELPENWPRTTSRLSVRASSAGSLASDGFLPSDGITSTSDRGIEKETETDSRNRGTLEEPNVLDLPSTSATPKCLDGREQRGFLVKPLTTEAVEEGYSGQRHLSATLHISTTPGDNTTDISLNTETDRRRPSLSSRGVATRVEDADTSDLPWSSFSPEGSRSSVRAAHKPELAQKTLGRKRETANDDGNVSGGRDCGAAGDRSAFVDDRSTTFTCSITAKNTCRARAEKSPADLDSQQSSRRRDRVVELFSDKGERRDMVLVRTAEESRNFTEGAGVTGQARQYHVQLSLPRKEAGSTQGGLRKMRVTKWNGSPSVGTSDGVPASEPLKRDETKAASVANVATREEGVCSTRKYMEDVSLHHEIGADTGKESVPRSNTVRVLPTAIREQGSLHSTLPRNFCSNTPSYRRAVESLVSGDRAGARGRCSGSEANGRSSCECSESKPSRSDPPPPSRTAEESTRQLCSKNPAEGIAPGQQGACILTSSVRSASPEDVKLATRDTAVGKKPDSSRSSLSSHASSAFSRPFFCTPSEQECILVDGAARAPRDRLFGERRQHFSPNAGSVCSAFLTPPATGPSVSSGLCSYRRHTDDTLEDKGLWLLLDGNSRRGSSGAELAKEAGPNLRDSESPHQGTGLQMSPSRCLFVSCSSAVAQVPPCPSTERFPVVKADGSRHSRRSLRSHALAGDQDSDGSMLYHVEACPSNSPKKAVNAPSAGTARRAEHPVETPNWGGSQRERLGKNRSCRARSSGKSEMVNHQTSLEGDSQPRRTGPGETDYAYTLHQLAGRESYSSSRGRDLHEKRSPRPTREETADASSVVHDRPVTSDVGCPPPSPEEPSSICHDSTGRPFSADREKTGHSLPCAALSRKGRSTVHSCAKPMQHTTSQEHGLLRHCCHGDRGGQAVSGREESRMLCGTEQRHTAGRLLRFTQNADQRGEGEEDLHPTGHREKTKDVSANAQEGGPHPSTGREVQAQEGGGDGDVPVVRGQTGQARGKRNRDMSFGRSGEQQRLELRQQGSLLEPRLRPESFVVRLMSCSEHRADSAGGVSWGVAGERGGQEMRSAHTSTRAAALSEEPRAHAASRGKVLRNRSQPVFRPLRPERSTSSFVGSSPAFCHSRQKGTEGGICREEGASMGPPMKCSAAPVGRPSAPAGMRPLQRRRSIALECRQDGISVSSASTGQEVRRKSEHNSEGRSGPMRTKQSSESYGPSSGPTAIFSPFLTTADPQLLGKNCTPQDNAVAAVGDPQDAELPHRLCPQEADFASACAPSAAPSSCTGRSAAQGVQRYGATGPAFQPAAFPDRVPRIPQSSRPGWRLCRSIFANNSTDSCNSWSAVQQESQQKITKAQQQRWQESRNNRQDRVRDRRTVSAPPCVSLTRYGTGEDGTGIRRARAEKGLPGRSNIDSDPGLFETDRLKQPDGLPDRDKRTGTVARLFAGRADGCQEGSLVSVPSRRPEQMVFLSPEETAQPDPDLLFLEKDGRPPPPGLPHRTSRGPASPREAVMVQRRNCYRSPAGRQPQLPRTGLPVSSRSSDPKKAMGDFEAAGESKPATRGRAISMPSAFVSGPPCSPESLLIPEKKGNCLEGDTPRELCDDCRQGNRDESVQRYSKEVRTKSASFVSLLNQQCFYRKGSSSDAFSFGVGYKFRSPIEDKREYLFNSHTGQQPRLTASPRRAQDNSVSHSLEACESKLSTSVASEGSGQYGQGHPFRHAESRPQNPRNSGRLYPASVQKSCSESTLPRLLRLSRGCGRTERHNHGCARELAHRDITLEKDGRESSQRKGCSASQRRQRLKEAQKELSFPEGVVPPSEHDGSTYCQACPQSDGTLGGGGTVIKVLVCPPFAAPLPPRRTPSVSSGCCGLSGELFQQAEKVGRPEGSCSTSAISKKSETKNSPALDVGASACLPSLRKDISVAGGTSRREAILGAEKCLRDERGLYGDSEENWWSSVFQGHNVSPARVAAPVTSATTAGHWRSGGYLLKSRDREFSVLTDYGLRSSSLTRGEVCHQVEEDGSRTQQVATSARMRREATEEEEGSTKRTETGNGHEISTPSTRALPGALTAVATTSSANTVTQGGGLHCAGGRVVCPFTSMAPAPVYLSENVCPTALLVRKVVWQIKPARPICACPAPDLGPSVYAEPNGVSAACISRMSEGNHPHKHVQRDAPESSKGASVSVCHGEQGSLHVELFPCACCGGFPEAHIVNVEQKQARGNCSQAETETSVSKIR